MIEEPLTRAATKERTEDHAMPVELQGITIRYDGGAEPLVIAEDFDLGLEAGTMHCLAGRSGSGKTSILTVAAGLQQPTAGEVFWQGDALSTMDDDLISDRRRALIGYVDQGGALIDGMSALENVLLPAVPDGQVEERCVLLLAEVVAGEQLRQAHHLRALLRGFGYRGFRFGKVRLTLRGDLHLPGARSGRCLRPACAEAHFLAQ